MSNRPGTAKPLRRAPFRLTAPVTPEHQAQIDCTKMLQRVLLPDVCWTAIDHANARDALTGAIRKARGVRAGIPDYLFWRLGKPYAIEFKPNGDLSDSQKKFLPEMIGAGVEVAVCRTASQVLQRLQLWGLCRPVRIMA